jgi:hypothetical protein
LAVTMRTQIHPHAPPSTHSLGAHPFNETS